MEVYGEDRSATLNFSTMVSVITGNYDHAWHSIAHFRDYT